MTEIFDDIRKLYHFQNPCTELSPFIEFFSETSLEAMAEHIQTEAFTVKLFPSYTPTIWINLGSSYTLKTGEKYKQIDANMDVLLLRNAIVERHNLATDNIFTIKFLPSACEAFFGISPSKIGDNIIDVHDIISPIIIKKLKNLSTLSERVTLLESYFLDKLAKKTVSKFPFTCVYNAIENYFQSGMVHKNNEISSNLYVSEKTMYRYFNQVVGTNPKNYFSIMRARKALIVYNSDKNGFSPYDFGYYDYGHFSKDVVKFTGQSLSSFF
jgi:AraC-like DNA-binding protein